MGLIERVSALAARRGHVLLVPVPGWDHLRMLVQASVRRRGWVLVPAPADADLLVTVGAPGQDLATLIDRVWNQLPTPRYRIELSGAEDIESALHHAAAALRDVASAREQAEPDPRDGGAQNVSGMSDEPDRPAGSAEGAALRQDGGAGAGHWHMDMDMDMDMAGPGGIPLASGFEGDRDGLEMDVTRLPLGPVLTEWPAGLVLDCTLSGDVVVEAAARLLPAATPAPASPLPPDGLALAGHLDAVAQVLRLAGWTGAAESAVRLLDEIVGGTAPAAARERIGRLHRRVDRSRLLRWNLGGYRQGPGEVAARIRAHLAAALAIAEGRGGRQPDEIDATALAEAVRGRGLADVRLLAAGLALRPAGSVAHHA